jgi:RNA-binding protein
MPLTPAQARQLRALAHHHKPVLMIGDKGVTDNIINDTERYLERDELIKVKVGGPREAVAAAAEALCAATGAELAGKIGKVLMLYRRRREGKPTIRLRRSKT